LSIGNIGVGANVVKAAGYPARQIDNAADMFRSFALDKYRNAAFMQVFGQTAQ
jgi:hypothetical protein